MPAFHKNIREYGCTIEISCTKPSTIRDDYVQTGNLLLESPNAKVEDTSALLMLFNDHFDASSFISFGLFFDTPRLKSCIPHWLTSDASSISRAFMDLAYFDLTALTLIRLIRKVARKNSTLVVSKAQVIRLRYYVLLCCSPPSFRKHNGIIYMSLQSIQMQGP